MVALARTSYEAAEDRDDRPVFPRIAEHSDRRIFGRAGNVMSVEALRLDHSIAARRQPRLTLEIRDISLGGMSALSDQRVEFGERVRVTFPPQKHMPWWDAFGRVVRCEPSAMGYRLAVEFDPLPAA